MLPWLSEIEGIEQREAVAFTKEKFAVRRYLKNASIELDLLDLHNAMLDDLTARVPRIEDVLPLKEYEDRRLWHPMGRNGMPARYLTLGRHRLVGLDDFAPVVDTFVPEWPHKIGPATTPAWRKKIGLKTNRGARKMSQTGFSMKFASPWWLVICLKRKMRREVLHALGKTGRRGKQKPHRRSQYSDINC